MEKRVLNLGAGVQSTTVLLLSLDGELPPFDHVVFADTGWEPQAVYDHLEWLETLCKIDVVSQGNIRTDALVSQVRGRKAEGQRWASMPLFVLGPNGERGQIRRQCTYEYKIRPIERYIRREVLGLKHRQRVKKDTKITQVFGISLDEFQRMRTATDWWKVHKYPLIDMRWTRRHCLEYLEKKQVITPRSACIGCPYRHNNEWRWLRDNAPDEFKDAKSVDEAIRNCGGRRGEVFLHSDRIPLADVNLSTDVERGQQLLWRDECEGMCGT